MGHLHHLKEEYRDLVRRLEKGTTALPEPQDEHARQGWREILEIRYTPEEAALAARMPVMPSTLERIAERLGVSPEELKPKLEGMCDKGLVLDLVSARTGKTKYLLAPPVVGFLEFSMMRAHDSVPKKRMAEALEAYTHGDPTFAREVFGRETVVGRAMVHEDALGDEPLPDVLDWERATSLIGDARTLAVSLCYCRHKASHLGKACDAPQEVCMSVDGGAEFVLRRNFGRRLERAEALELLSAARERGLVQIADNVQDRPSYLCNCCGCCCGQLQAINEFDLPGVNPSGFLAGSDEPKCAGCSRCARACPIAAITMVPKRGAAERRNALHPHVDEERCIGCGVCVTACHKGAMRMRRRERQPHVPANVIERSVRAALERGRLADLLFDEGASRGHRFLNHALSALIALPPAKQALASEQVRSRFVSFALKQVRDPTR